MFWGLNLKPNRKYSQVTTKTFHISQAAIEDGKHSKVYISVENQKYLICTLDLTCKQMPLDLNFNEQEEISFHVVGDGSVALTGYVLTDVLGDDESDFSDDIIQSVKDKSKGNKKAQKENEADDDENEDFEDSELELGVEEEEQEEDDESSDENAEEDDEDGEVDEDESDSDEEIEQPKAKQRKLEISEKKQNGVAKSQALQSNDKKNKKDKQDLNKETKKGKSQQQQQQQKQQPQQKTKQQNESGVRNLAGGVKIVDIVVGNGPEAKPGKNALVYYVGRLKSNNTVFDSLKEGKGFKFNIGRGDVIKGWDIGVPGMKVGGKRRITIPPHMAYGARGSPPVVPPNSCLIFDVELKSVN